MTNTTEPTVLTEAPNPHLRETGFHPGRATYSGIPRMPALFGRQGGPRQLVDREGRHPLDVGRATVSWMARAATASELERLLPRGFELAEPLLIVDAVSVEDLPWLAGRGYELLTVSVPVNFVEGRHRQRGRLAIVTWEDCPDAIVSGRDELGYNKVYADTMRRTAGDSGSHVRYSAGWGGTTFFELDIALAEGSPSVADWRSGPTFHYRVIPRTGAWGDLEVEQVTADVLPAAPRPDAVRSAHGGTGTFRFNHATFEELPTLVHIVNTLADLSLGETVDAGNIEMSGWNDLADMRIVAHWPVSPPPVHSFATEEL